VAANVVTWKVEGQDVRSSEDVRQAEDARRGPRYTLNIEP